ncbi:unnamed protein product [Callosobruchus maculatus]|uniref:Cuticle protein n=1 Tax=Callosobruchus maculatus TaxID=64391 RepID=A0A653C2I9_CALMS|nr:unnamed protein product [Callosobruchus maculatus]
MYPDNAVLIAAFLTIAKAGIITSPLANVIVDSEYSHHEPHYTYGYDVNDVLTGDSKSQVETRHGDVVKGSYSLNEPDGTRRIVDYVADPINGFNAIVRKAPLVHAALVPAHAAVIPHTTLAHKEAKKVTTSISHEGNPATGVAATKTSLSSSHQVDTSISDNSIGGNDIVKVDAAVPVVTHHQTAPLHHSSVVETSSSVVHSAPVAVAHYTSPYAVNAGFIQQAAAPVAYAAPIAKVAAPVAYAAPVAKTLVSEEYDPHPQYNYGYDIEDHLTGDSKSQHESRDGDVVQGSYSLTDPDGTRRTVDYTADPINGFNAVVRKEPIGIVQKAVVAAPAIAKVAAPVAYAAPVAKFAAAPVAYAAPAVAKVAYYH